MNNYLTETLDEFVTRRNNENINNYNAGYEQALQDILEMIEENASYDEVYESIGEYLEENSKTEKVKQHLGKNLGNYAAGGVAAAGLGLSALALRKAYKKGKELPDSEGRSVVNTIDRGANAVHKDIVNNYKNSLNKESKYLDKQGRTKGLKNKAKVAGKYYFKNEV